MLRTQALLALGLFAATAAALPLADEAPGRSRGQQERVVPRTPRYTFSAGGAPQPELGPADVERALSDLERRSGKLELEFRGVDRAFQEIYQKSVLRGRAYVRLARAGLLPVGGGFEELMAHAVRLERLRQGLARDGLHGQTLAERRRELLREMEDLRRQEGPLRVQNEAMALARDALRASEERALAFERAFLHSGPRTGHTAVYGASAGPTEARDLQGGFAAMKGRLPFPLAGRTEVRRVRRPGAGGLGLEMSAHRGDPVRAVYPGRVAFADTYSDYGKTVILDHSDGYYTVSAALEQIEVATGEEVLAGGRLGTVGGDALAGASGAGSESSAQADTSGVSATESDAHGAASEGAVSEGAAASARKPRHVPRGYLYFEVRRGADVVDPNAWFGI